MINVLICGPWQYLQKFFNEAKFLNFWPKKFKKNWPQKGLNTTLWQNPSETLWVRVRISVKTKWEILENFLSRFIFQEKRKIREIDTLQILTTLPNNTKKTHHPNTLFYGMPKTNFLSFFLYLSVLLFTIKLQFISTDRRILNLSFYFNDFLCF